jgi:sensor histidine kinase YesM
LIAGIIVLLLFSGLVLRNIVLKRKNDQLKSQQEQLVLKRRALELEMQALRAQMNPHFIFNCLSAIDNLIQTNQSDKATTYLSRFAKLIRGILDSSKNNLVPFQRDFETMKLYLEIEEFRCNNKFRYELNADEILLNSDYKVPPLVIQPFIENAIHHGLLNKTGSSRQLKINAHLQNEDIIYSITDNGIGRKQAMRLRELNRPGQQSYGIEITRERILLHNKNSSSDDLQIHDLEEAGMAAGTEVTVRVNCFS